MRVSVMAYSFHGLLEQGRMDIFGFLETCKYRYRLETADLWNGFLKSTDEAKSPHRILVRSLLKSRNKLREKYRELRAECKRWRNQAAAVERSRSTWRERALAHEARAQEDQAARANLESQL